MKNKILILSLFFGVIIESCTHHFFVKDNKFVRTQSGYLLFFENNFTINDTGIIEDPYIVKLNGTNDIKTLFFKEALDTNLSKSEIAKRLGKNKIAIEFGDFCERIELLEDLSDTLMKTKSGIFYFIPAKVSLIKIHDRKSYHEVKINFGDYSSNLNISDASFQILNVEPVFNQKQFDYVKAKSMMKKNNPTPY